MTCKDCIGWLKSLKKQIQYLGLWHYEQTLTETIELLQSDRIVELPPYNIGDYAYVITIKKDNDVIKYIIVRAKVTGFEIDETGILEVKLVSEHTTFVLFVENVYLSLPEAEEALKALTEKSDERR